MSKVSVKGQKIDFDALRVENNVELRKYPKTSFGPNVRKGPWWTMLVGQSIFIPNINNAKAHSLVSGPRQKNKWVFEIRKDTVDGVEGYRIWRTK